jgi:hypothetical protein
MALLLQLKSLYLGIFNATMISRSIGRDLSKKRLRAFKIALFGTLDDLTDKMDSDTLTEADITKAIARLAQQFRLRNDYCENAWSDARKPAARDLIISERNGRGSRLFGRDTIANAQASKRNRHGPRNNQDHEYNTPGRQPRP